MKAKYEAIAIVLTVGLGAYVAVSIFSRAKDGLTGAAKSALDAINPANPGNVVARAADAVVQAVTGDPNTSVGSKLYDLVNPNAPRADAPVQLGSRAQPHAQALLDQFGPSTRTREDEAWMQGQLYGPTVQAADDEDAYMGAAMGKSIGLEANRYGAGFSMTKL